jgi:hypothetical protein
MPSPPLIAVSLAISSTVPSAKTPQIIRDFGLVGRAQGLIVEITGGASGIRTRGTNSPLVFDRKS